MMTLTHESGSISSENFIVDNNFEGWNCMINWYFLYIHQEIDAIWHHQTCQVDLTGQVSPITTISNFSDYNDSLEDKMISGSIPYIRCPKNHCGCGLCVPKAKSDSDALALFNSHTRDISPQLMNKKDVDRKGSLKSKVIQFDSRKL
jgi:hypothetical protein